MVKFCGNDISHTPSVTNDRNTTQKQITTIILTAIIRKEEIEFVASLSWKG